MVRKMEVFIPITFFVFLGAIILVPTWLRERTKQSAHQLISQAIEKGQTLDPTVLERLTETPKRKDDRARNTLGSGVVLIALSMGFAAAAYFSGQFDPSGAAHGGMMIPAVILGSLGLGFLALAIVDYATRSKKAQD